MFKHEPPLALYFAASQVESKVWQQKTATLLKKLGSQNYEMRPASVIKLSAKYNNLGLPEPLITAKSTGVLAALPSAELCQGSVLAISAQIISALNKFKLSSAGTDQLAKLHPALRWWSGTDHLVSLRPDHSISLNIADVAANHARAADYGDHGYQQGADSLWQNLLGRYEKLASDLHGQVESKQLAPEYAEVQ